MSSKWNAKGTTALQKKKLAAASQRRVERAIQLRRATSSNFAQKSLIDLETILQNLSQHVKTYVSNDDQMQIAKSVQAAMLYDITQDEIWKTNIGTLRHNEALYMRCRPTYIHD